jgi:hydrogenase maturation protease
MSSHPRVRLLVCGAGDRGDDGAALAAAATLLPTLDEEHRGWLEIRRCGQLDVQDLLDLPEGMAGVIVDAAIGIPPGAIITIPFDQLTAAGVATGPRSSHAMPIDQVLTLASTLRDRPLRGTFVGIGGRRFGFGQSLSRVVRAAMPAYREAIAEEIERLVAEPPEIPLEPVGG